MKNKHKPHTTCKTSVFRTISLQISNGLGTKPKHNYIELLLLMKRQENVANLAPPEQDSTDNCVYSEGT